MLAPTPSGPMGPANPSEAALRSSSRRYLSLLAVLSLCAFALSAATAEAIVTSSHITTPAGTTYPLSNKSEEGPPITVSGSVTGPLSEVDIRCYYSGSGYVTLASKVAVTGAGFTAAVPRINFGESNAVLCRLRAVPTGSSTSYPPAEEGAYNGPLVAPANFSVEPTYYEATGNSLSGYMYVQDASSCGLESHLVNPVSLQATQYLFYCNGMVLDRPAPGSVNAQVDGRYAYSPRRSSGIEANVLPVTTPMPGKQPLTIVSKSFDESNGNLSITERDPYVTCTPEQLEEPTKASCTGFAPLGVTLERRWTFTDAERVATMTDVWRSTDGKAHTVTYNYFNEFEQPGEKVGGVFGSFEFPGTSAFAGTTPNETVALPSGPGTVFYKYDNTTPDAGDNNNPQGAVVYDRPPTSPLKVTRATSIEETANIYLAPYTLSLPAGGSSVVRTTYIQGFGLPEIQAKAEAAIAGFAPTISIAAPANSAKLETESPAVAVSGSATDTGALASLTVNGAAVTVGADGGWSTSVPLKTGANTIKATATDQAGLTKSATVSVTYKIPPGKAALKGKVSVTKGKVTFSLKCTGAAGSKCSVKDTLSTIERRKGSKILGLLARVKKRTVTVASGAQSIDAGKTMKVTLKLNATGRALLKRFHKLPAHLTVTVAAKPKAKTVISKSLTIKRH